MKISESSRITVLAREFGIPYTTLRDAAKTGRLRCQQHRCGLRVSTEDAVKEFISAEFAKGRPRQWQTNE